MSNLVKGDDSATPVSPTPMSAAEKTDYRKQRNEEDAAQTVALAAGISQALWSEGRDIFVREAEYPNLMLLVETNLFHKLETMARRGWVAGWDLTGAAGNELVVMAPGGTAPVVSCRTMADRAWMVVRPTAVGGVAAPTETTPEADRSGPT